MLVKFNRVPIEPRYRLTVILFLGTLSLILLTALPRGSSSSQASGLTRATITEIVGQQVLIKDRPARPRDVAILGQRVRTTQARTQLNFNTGAVGRLGKNSALTVGYDCFRIQRGEIVVKGAVNGCTQTIKAGVRGTAYYINVDENGRTEVGVLEGKVQLTPLKKLDLAPISLLQGEGIKIDPEGNFGAVVPWSSKRFERILDGELFEEFETEFPGLAQVQQALETVFPGETFLERNSSTTEGDRGTKLPEPTPDRKYI